MPVGPAEVAAVATGVVAAATDVVARRIPNVLTFGSALGGLAWHAWTGGLPALGWSVAGWAAGCAMLLPLFYLRATGAGDVKLLAAFGAWLGPIDAAWAGLLGTIAGGALALAVALATGYMGTACRNLYTLLMFWRVEGMRPMDQLTLDTSRGPRLPRAVPMLAGLVGTLWLRR